MDFILISQEENHPFYDRINDYFANPFIDFNAKIPDIFFTMPPLGACLITTSLKNAGFSVKMAHNPLLIPEEKDALLNALKTKPKAVGISTTHIFNPKTFEKLTNLVKSISPESIIISGGPSLDHNIEMRKMSDISILGPGEKFIVALMKAIKNKLPLKNFPSVTTTDGNLILNQNNNTLKEKDIPIPDWDIFKKNINRVSIETSRGCQYNCVFCSYSTGGFYERSIEGAITEIKSNLKKHNIRFFRFTDSDFAFNNERAKKICEKILELPSPLSWTCFARADSLLDIELLKLMRKAGCLWIFIGTESGSDTILKKMKKGTDVKTMHKAINLAKSAGINIHGNFVIGFPGETKETVKETMDFIKKSQLDTVYFSPMQIRNIHMKEQLKESNLEIMGDNFKWKHSTMDSQEAIKTSIACAREIYLNSDSTFIGTETLFFYIIKGLGDKFNSEVFTVLNAYRDYYRAKANSNLEIQKEKFNILNSMWRKDEQS
jgi:radical SAM superfamily enzyme YgiQ (UPF0313 family)